MNKFYRLLEIWKGSGIPGRILEEGEAGVPEVARAFVLAALRGVASPLFVVAPRSRDAEHLASALEAWLPREEVALYPAWEVLPGEAVSPTLEVMGRRIRVLREVAEKPHPRVIVAPVRAFLQMVAPPRDEPIHLEPGSSANLDEIVSKLVGFGFERNYLVERSGEFSVRGGILDVFPPGGEPVRADFFGDEISDLRKFSVSSQRSEEEISRLELLPTRELLLDDRTRASAEALLSTIKDSEDPDPDRSSDLEKIAGGIVFPGMEGYLADLVPDLAPPTAWIPEDGEVVIVDPKSCRDRAAEFLEQASQWGGESTSRLYVGFDEAATRFAPIELWPFGRGDEALTIDVRGWDEFLGRPDELASRLKKLMADGATVVVAAGRSAPRVSEVLAEADLILPIADPGLGASAITDVPLDRGFLFSDETTRLAIIGEGDLFGRRRASAAPPAEAPARAAALLLQLGPGDYVVHELYGVGRYHGMVTRDIGGISRDYLLVEYYGGDRLYVPTEQLDAVTRYTGGDAPKLNRLGTAEWEKAKSRARRAVKDIAEELVVLYAKRSGAKGHAFSIDTPWQRQLEDAFAYVETHDQARAIDEVKGDMERAVPMDRLICGDVGYGKTEIAVRAAFKSVQDSKQVTVLVPTTILAQQHTQTFRDRFAGFPVEVAQLSRFLTDREQRDVLDKLSTGKVDVVIGTHRLLQPDVKFNDLGLLIVDEEQRFGVKHKEQIKKLREAVDVLTLSATPIPRTLEMSLTGIRDMSLVDTPPADRRPVLTYVGENDERMVAAAIRRELARDGQVFYVHNRVRSIKGAARRLGGLVPGARIEMAHGQMSESELERVMVEVWEGKVDVLVCTTIIESGLDIPAMNTLIVERADLLGLSQLYQLRGRVGRAGERAYAYLFYPHEAALTDEAHERLKTLSEFTELGSGFKIALRDLEIRGAGNLLGAQQSGHIAAVGFDLYVRMMSQAVQSLAGKEPEASPEIRIDLPLDAFVPASYIARESLRMEAYREIEKIRSGQEAIDLREELVDRFGPLPDVVENLIQVAEIRAFMFERGLTELNARDGTLKVKPFPALSESAQVRLKRLLPKAVVKEVSATLLVPSVPARDLGSWVLSSLRAILTD